MYLIIQSLSSFCVGKAVPQTRSFVVNRCLLAYSFGGWEVHCQGARRLGDSDSKVVPYMLCPPERSASSLPGKVELRGQRGPNLSSHRGIDPTP